MSVLVVQMGHSGRTTGATGAPGEMAFTEAVGAACARLLGGRGGWSVRLVPADPAASAYRGDAFVAVHADGSANPAVAGASVGYQTAQGEALAAAWRDAYRSLGWTGPWHPDNYTANLAQYYGVRAAVAQGNRRACIVECGTITNPAEHAAMTSQAGVDRAALAIGAAVGITAGPTEEEPLTDEDVAKIVKAVKYQVLASDDFRFDGRNPVDLLRQSLETGFENQQALTALAEKVDALTAALGKGQP